MGTYVIIFSASLLASLHCIGMCGCFALLAGRDKKSTLGRTASQALYSVGRLFTYVFLGVAAGSVGTAIWEMPWGKWAMSALSLLSGVVFVVVALEILGVWRRFGPLSATFSRWLGMGIGPLIQHFAGRQSFSATFAMGVFTGLLPCGLVYAFALRAASSGDALTGGLTMLAFGLGTLPAMVSVGLLGGLLSGTRRLALYRLSAVILLVLGTVTILRGTPLAANIMHRAHSVVEEEHAPGWDPTCAGPARSE